MATVQNNTDAAFLAMLEADTRELQRIRASAFVSNGELCMPGMEGFFSRLWGSFNNAFMMYFNVFSDMIIAFEAMFKQDWVLYCRRFIKRIKDNMPDPEVFGGAVCWRSSKMGAEKSRSCLEAVVRMVDNLDKVLMSNDKSAISGDITNVIRYLEANHCTVDLKHPSKSKSATRYTYGDFGRLGTAGYGTDPMMYLNAMSNGLDKYVDLYNRLTNTQKIEQAQKRMESELNRLMASTDKMNDRQKEEASARINNIRARFVATRAIIRAATDMFHTTLLVNYILPLERMGLVSGMKDDLVSWIFAPSDNN